MATTKNTAPKTSKSVSKSVKTAVKETKTEKAFEEVTTVKTAEKPVEKCEIQVVPKKKILFVASEAAPFIATGGLAEVVGSLSKALAKDKNYDVRVIVPLYQDVKKEYRK